jgi:hypothetical protein
VGKGFKISISEATIPVACATASSRFPLRLKPRDPPIVIANLKRHLLKFLRRAAQIVCEFQSPPVWLLCAASPGTQELLIPALAPFSS